ncbi:CB1 cannabinoid receptor-interacting protein 1, partial [Gryllus bimaculatus]
MQPQQPQQQGSFRVTLSIRKEPEGGPVFCKMEQTQRFKQLKTVKLHTDTTYRVDVSFKPPRSLHTACAYSSYYTTEGLKPSKKGTREDLCIVMKFKFKGPTFYYKCLLKNNSIERNLLAGCTFFKKRLVADYALRLTYEIIKMFTLAYRICLYFNNFNDIQRKKLISASTFQNRIRFEKDFFVWFFNVNLFSLQAMLRHMHNFSTFPFLNIFLLIRITSYFKNLFNFQGNIFMQKALFTKYILFLYAVILIFFKIIYATNSSVHNLTRLFKKNIPNLLTNYASFLEMTTCDALVTQINVNVLSLAVIALIKCIFFSVNKK